MKKAFGDFQQIYCVNHLLNNVVEKAVQEVQEVAELCRLCSELVKFFKKSGQNCNLNSTLKSFCPTRWNTIYYLLVSIEKNWVQIGNILQEKKHLQKIDKINIHYIRCVVNILKPFEEASQKLEGEKYPTIHLVYAHIRGFENTCTPHNDDIDVMKRFKEALGGQIQSVVTPNLFLTHKIALFLFPPGNKLPHFSEHEKDIVKTECANQVKLYCDNAGEEENVAPNLDESNCVESSFFGDSIAQCSNNRVEDNIANEIRTYGNLRIPFGKNFDPLRWWHLHEPTFPLLYKLACKILSTPASSAASERIFSVARHILSEKRTNISYNSDTFNQIIYLHFNAENFDAEYTSILDISM